MVERRIQEMALPCQHVRKPKAPASVIHTRDFQRTLDNCSGTLEVEINGNALFSWTKPGWGRKSRWTLGGTSSFLEENQCALLLWPTNSESAFEDTHDCSSGSLHDCRGSEPKTSASRSPAMTRRKFLKHKIHKHPLKFSATNDGRCLTAQSITFT